MKDAFFLDVVLNFLEPDLATLIDGIIYGIDDHEDLFVFQLVSAVNDKVALQLTCLINARESG